MDISTLSVAELIRLYGGILKRLKEEGVIRTNNLVGELGEYIVIDHYCKTKQLPKLQAAPPSTKNIDAISVEGDRYSIKATSTKTTGAFYGLNEKGSNKVDTKKFEYVVIVVFDSNMKLLKMIELDWNTFLKHRKWHKRINAWNLTVTKALISDSILLVDNILE